MIDFKHKTHKQKAMFEPPGISENLGSGAGPGVVLEARGVKKASPSYRNQPGAPGGMQKKLVQAIGISPEHREWCKKS